MSKSTKKAIEMYSSQSLIRSNFDQALG